MPGGSSIREWGRRVPMAFWRALLQSHLDTSGRLSRTSTAAVRQGIHSGRLNGLIYTGKMEGIHHKKWLHTFQVQQERRPGESSRQGELGIQCCLGYEGPPKPLLGNTIYAVKIPTSGVFIHSRQLQLGQFLLLSV